MELLPKQQVVELIKKSENLLLLAHSDPGGDSVGSLLAFAEILKEIGKNPTVIVSDPMPSTLEFLPFTEQIKDAPDGARDLVLKINIENIGIEKISTNTDGKTLDIIITPETGKLEKKDATIEEAKPQYDAIIVLDTPDVDKIDRIYDQYTELFFETPVINIDHHPGNEYFGTINWVDLTATSTAEILVAIFEALGKSKPNEDVATLLLAGITADTASFKNTNTTPKTLTVAAQLLAAGGRLQEIIQNLYKAKSMKALKLWGKILSNVQKDSEYRIVWSKVGFKDFDESGASLEEAREVMDEMLANTPNVDVVGLIVETERNISRVILKGVKGTDVLSIAESFGGSGQNLSASFEMKNVSLESAEAKILDRIRNERAKKLGKAFGRNEKSVTKEKIEPKRIEKRTDRIEPQKSEESSMHENEWTASLASEESDAETQPKRDEPQAGDDAISRAIESLEASGETIEAEKPEAESPEETGTSGKGIDKVIQKDPGSMTHVSEILKKFDPTDKKKLEEFKKKNEEAREKLRKEKQSGEEA